MIEQTMTNLTKSTEWQALSDHQQHVHNIRLRDLFAQNPQRFKYFSLQACGLLLDYSRNLINETTINLLTELAKSRGLKEKIIAQFEGAPINTTEHRPVLHTALRDHTSKAIYVNGHDIKSDIQQALNKMAQFTDAIQQEKWLGITGKPIKHIVNIGIGGSYTGPMMATIALKDFAKNDLQFHFLATIDKVQLDETLKQIEPEQSLFIISSKSFNTIETLTNAKTILEWMQNQYGNDVVKYHFVAVTAAADKAKKFGIPENNIFPLWSWVGGRYSLWSAIGLPLMLMLGETGFRDFLAGAHEMDLHFLTAEFKYNMPVLLALLSIWYTNFFNASVQAIIPYAHRLRYFVPYLQQADMESNGKGVDLAGVEPNYATGPVLFGEEGVIGQHAYHQLLHQGRHFIPADFIVVGNGGKSETHHDVLIASALSQAQALMRGKTIEEAKSELLAKNIPEKVAAELAHHQAIPGNKPTNIIYMQELTPKTLGALIALYEHKIFVQGAIWDINSFDQWGVELGKQLLPNILNALQGEQNVKLDVATTELIKLLRSGKT